MNKTSIEWCDFAANPIRYRDTEGKSVWACVKASEGCQHCYAEALAHRYQGREFTAKEMEGVTPYVDDRELKAMLSPAKLPAGSKVFVEDMSDLFGEWVTDEMLDRVFAVFALRPDVVFQVLTKRPERMREYLSEEPFGAAERVWGKWNNIVDHAFAPEWPGWPLPNVWLGVSAENQHWCRVNDRDLADYILHFKPTQAEVIPYYADLLRVGHAQDVRWGELNAAIVSRWSLSGLKRIKREAWRTLQ